MTTNPGKRQVRHLHADTATARPGGRTARVGQAVIDATIAELGDVGYAALRIDSVAERAGVNKTTIYRRWGDKAGLVATAFIERQSESAPPPDTGDLREDLLLHLGEIREVLYTPWITALVQEVGPRTSEKNDVREVLDRIWPERFRLSRTIFVRAVERGDLPADADPDFLLEALAGPLYFRRLMLGRPLGDDFLEKTADLVLHGARPESGEAGS
ncbi:TetR/AcrR family transcriptional regulator [Streptomyces sp. NBC_01619]|uniref:TetR/AcrR family transcriptional regulator n=1 Tax=Streptomyces sp. NBC_01619 TaxID=2975901 RepID=UPI00224D62C1|nr:TetR/AcrR family transcriptional regulator [Streptomyces sp. NBC_01619]MCX4511108.1 TetR/AcrR family transcriptional regulator [Streptomyces sp. NBC_01619]